MVSGGSYAGRAQNRTASALYVFFPVFAEQLGSATSESDAVLGFVALRDAIVTMATDFEDSRFWLNVVDLFKEIIAVSISRSQHAPKPTMLANQEYESVGVLWDLGTSNQRGIHLKDSIKRQVLSLGHFLQGRGYIPLKHIMPGVGKFLFRFWADVASTQGFSLNNPALFRQELAELPQTLDTQAVLQLITHACRAVGVRLSPELGNLFKQASLDEELLAAS
jgi:hypothetical protein